MWSRLTFCTSCCLDTLADPAMDSLEGMVFSCVLKISMNILCLYRVTAMNSFERERECERAVWVSGNLASWENPLLYISKPLRRLFGSSAHRFPWFQPGDWDSPKL